MIALPDIPVQSIGDDGIKVGLNWQTPSDIFKYCDSDDLKNASKNYYKKFEERGRDGTIQQLAERGGIQILTTNEVIIPTGIFRFYYLNIPVIYCMGMLTHYADIVAKKLLLTSREEELDGVMDASRVLACMKGIQEHPVAFPIWITPFDQLGQSATLADTIDMGVTISAVLTNSVPILEGRHRAVAFLKFARKGLLTHIPFFVVGV